jgi:hypothetical protein
MYEKEQIAGFFTSVLKRGKQFMDLKMLHVGNFYYLWCFQDKLFSHNNLWSS